MSYIIYLTFFCVFCRRPTIISISNERSCVNMVKRLWKTYLIILLWCLIWMVLEYLMYGEIQSRMVDNIMTLLFIPFAWKSTKESA